MAVYCCSDIHGNYKIWEKIKNYLKDDDVLYFLGDAADRGSDGWLILKEALNHLQVKYILGNHDQMLIDRFLRQSYDNVALHIQNGGDPTWKMMLADDENTIADTIAKLMHCSYYTIYEGDAGKIFMSHSGSTNTNDYFNLIWERNAFGSDDDEEYDYIVHGHTGIMHLIEDLNNWRRFSGKEEVDDWDGYSAYHYAGNRVDIDMTTILTKQSILLNLDTMESIIIEEN